MMSKKTLWSMSQVVYSLVGEPYNGQIIAQMDGKELDDDRRKE